jgi:hypothetical protein
MRSRSASSAEDGCYQIFPEPIWRFLRSSLSLETLSWHRMRAFSSQGWEPLS